MHRKLLPRFVLCSLILSFCCLSYADNNQSAVFSQTNIYSNNFELKPDQIYEKINQSVFKTKAHKVIGSQVVEIQGSAVAISDKLLATNCHVTLESKALLVTVNNEQHLGLVKYKHEKEDLCLVEVPNINFAPVQIRASNSVRIGEEVCAVGNPVGLEKTISRGKLPYKTYGVYGKSHIALFKNKRSGQTFVAIPGRNKNGDIDCYALWNPKFPKVVAIIPFARNLGSAVEIINKYSSDLAYSGLGQMDNVALLIDQNRYNYVYGFHRGNDYIFLDSFDSSLTNAFKQKSAFWMLYKNDSFEDVDIITFSLYGFTDAYNAYKEMKSKSA